MTSRIVYQNWIVDLGRDPETLNTMSEVSDQEQINSHTAHVCQAVEVALNQLEEDEREFIIRFHYMGESYRQISDKSSRSVHKLEALHKRTMKRLRKLLAPFVGEVFDLEVKLPTACPICCSKHADQLNEIINNRNQRETWKPIMDLFRTKYNLVISSPQLLVGHEKYH